MSEQPDSHAFPATKLGDFLRAMADPEGTGAIDPVRAREIATIEESIAETREGRPAYEQPPAGGLRLPRGDYPVSRTPPSSWWAARMPSARTSTSGAATRSA